MFTIKEGTEPTKIGEGTPDDVKANIVSWMEKNGYVVRTTDQESQFLKTKTQEEIDRAFSERNTQIEQTIFEQTKIPKNTGEKYYDYLKRAISESTKEMQTLKTKLTELESKGLGGSELAQQYKAELEQLRTMHTKTKEEYEGELNKLKGSLFENKVRGMVDTALAKIKGTLKSDTIDPRLMEDIIAARMARFYGENKAKDLEGHIIWTDDKGATHISKKDGKPQSIDERILPYFEDLIDKGRQQGGAGSGGAGGGAGGAGGAKWKEITVPATVKTKVALHEFLSREHKLAENTKEFAEAYENLGKGLPLR